MARHTTDLKKRLRRVRRRWRLGAALRGLVLVVTEALGMFLVFLLADAIYSFSGQVRLGMLGAGGVVLAVLFARHVLYGLFRPISDEQAALLLEERADTAQGAVISAVEFRDEHRGGLHDFIVSFLVDDAVRRIDRTNLSVVTSLRRLRKHAVAMTVILLVFAGTTLTFPHFTRYQAERIVNPMRSIREEQEAQRKKQEAEQERQLALFGKIGFTVRPGDMNLLRGRGATIEVQLSRRPVEPPVLVYVSETGQPQQLRMQEVDAINTYQYDVPDVNEHAMYHIAAAGQESDQYKITVYDRLSFRGIELTYTYPKYLDLDAETVFRRTGDIRVPAGTRVDIRVVANNALKSGKIVVDGKKTLPLKPAGPKASDGVKTSLTVAKDATYTFSVTDTYGDKFSYDSFYVIKAVPDKEPTVDLVCPKVDMSVHPLYEVTFRADIGDDYGIKSATVKADLFRGVKRKAFSWPMKTVGAKGQEKNVRDGSSEYVLALEDMKPLMGAGDMMFYHVEVADRKGQIARTDVFFIKIWPLEVAAAWPDSVAPPDLPHETFNDPMDLMLFLAAAWALEQDRGKIAQAEFNAKSEKIAQRMEVGDPPDFGSFWGHGGAPGGGGPNAAQILTVATQQIETAHGLLKFKHQPGKAADHMRVALAMVESLAGNKNVLALELNPEPIHTGQPSSGHADDPVMEQMSLRSPSVMSDSLTAFQQPDNPPRLLPPDYRRALRIKQRQGARTKQLKMAGEIYVTEEQLIEMAREQLGHIRLREAIDDNTPNDPAQSSGGGGEEERVDRRAIPYKELVTADQRRAHVARADKLTLSEPKVKRIKNTLKYDKLKDNKRRGGPNPYMSQAQGSGGGGDDEEKPPPEPLDEKALKRLRKQMAMRRPSSAGGGGGGGEQQPMGQQDPNAKPSAQQAGGSQAAMQQMAQWQEQLAATAGRLARGVAGTMSADDKMSKAAVDEMRRAATGMQAAAKSFRRGDVRRGISQAQRAQRALKTATDRLRASQYDSLESAVAAAQTGAMALVANQYRISHGTKQLAKKVNEITGQPAKGQPGQGQPGQGQPGKGQPTKGQPSGQGGKGQPTKGQPSGQGGKGQPGKGQAGKGEDVPMPSAQAVAKAVAGDPRVGPQMKGLAKEQANLAKATNDYAGYVDNLKKWAGEAQKDRVAGSLGDVSKGLKSSGTSQKMVDVAVSLASRDLKGARTGQLSVEKDLQRMISGIHEAGEILAGSPTGVLRRVSRTATEIGTKAAQIARGGQPGQGQRGQGQRGQGQPGQGQPGKGQPGTSTQPGKGQPGTSTQPGKGQPGTSTQPGKAGPKGRGQLAKALSGSQSGSQSGDPSGRSQPGSMGGGGVGRNEDIDEMWLKTKGLVSTLKREALVDEKTLQLIERKATDIRSFRKMFELANKADAGKFADLMLGVGKDLRSALEEALIAKQLNTQQREECPPKYRSLVNAYFEALSKAASKNK